MKLNHSDHQADTQILPSDRSSSVSTLVTQAALFSVLAAFANDAHADKSRPPQSLEREIGAPTDDIFHGAAEISSTEERRRKEALQAWRDLQGQALKALSAPIGVTIPPAFLGISGKKKVRIEYSLWKGWQMPQPKARSKLN
jgi:hypothetical protein